MMIFLCLLLSAFIVNVQCKSAKNYIGMSEAFVFLEPLIVDGVTAMMTKEVHAFKGSQCILNFELHDGRYMQAALHNEQCSDEQLEEIRERSLEKIREFKRNVRTYHKVLTRCTEDSQTFGPYTCIDEVAGADKASRRDGWSCMKWTCPGDSTEHEAGRIFMK